MATLQADAHVNKKPEQVAELLCSEDFLVAIEKPREEVVDAVYRLIEKTDDITVFEIAVTGYKHNKKGDMDKSGTTTNVAEYRWERSKQLLSFHYRGSGRIIIGGTYHLQPEESGTRLSFEASITSLWKDHSKPDQEGNETFIRYSSFYDRVLFMNLLLL
jgi:hypothetical protein